MQSGSWASGFVAAPDRTRMLYPTATLRRESFAQNFRQDA
jgi:hypothetical protein